MDKSENKYSVYIDPAANDRMADHMEFDIQDCRQNDDKNIL